MKTHPHRTVEPSGPKEGMVTPLRALRDYLSSRMGRRISAEQLGELGNRSASSVRNIECGISQLSLKHAQCYEKRFDVPVDWLLQPLVKKGAVPPTRAGGEIIRGIPESLFAETSNGAAEDLVFQALRRKLKSCGGTDYVELLNSLAAMSALEDDDE